MFENLSERLERSFKILKGEGKITEVNISEAMKDIRRALLDADVSYKIAKQFCDEVKKKAIGQNVLTAVKPQQMIVKIVHDELAALMGSQSSDINIKGAPAVVLVAGLNGSGKTTFSGKLALNIKSKRGMKVLLAACDYFRPAAIDQLKVLGEQIGVPVYAEEGVKDPIQIAKNAIAKAKAEGYSVVIVDTAGRLAVDQELMDEISALHQAVQPTETLFVVDAMTGQDAVETAKAFNERLDFDGVVLTKMDGGMKVLLAACDYFRPAAIDQLKVLGEQIGVPVYAEEGVKDPIQIAKNAIAKAKAEGYSVVIVDTAGRLAVDQELMDEISALHQAVQPTETLFVVDAMTGQDAVETAKAFNERLDFDGVVLTKMDGDTRGGAALSIKAVVGKPIKFVSTGEKMEALDVFHPSRIADRILGMGDVVSLVEKAQEQFDEAQARELKKKLAKDQFTLWDFYNQIQQIKKMGNIKDLASMIPGLGKAIKDVYMDNDSFKGIEAIILSMTPYEREHPDCINGSRRKRIADGSGTSLPEVNKLLKQFEGTRKMMKTVMGANMGNMMKGAMRRRR